MVSPTDSIASVASALKPISAELSARAKAGAVGQVQDAAKTDFANMLWNVSSQMSSSLKAAETTAVAGMQGRADITRVVSTLMEAEQNLQAAIAVRDKVVAAYMEISRMTI